MHVDADCRSTSLSQAILAYLRVISDNRSVQTHHTYRYALKAFARTLSNHHIPPDETPPAGLPEDAMAWFAEALKASSPATEKLYLTAAAGFFEFLAAESLAMPNLPRVRLLLRTRSRKIGPRLPDFKRDDIEKLLEYAINLAKQAVESNENGMVRHLRNLRDRAFLVALADTGLRVHEACNLRRGDVDWNEGRAIIIGKGDKQAVVRFSRRSLAAIREYLGARAALDGTSGKPLATLPVFARHDKGAGKKIKAITTTTGRNIVAQRVEEALGSEFAGKITPHTLRHYFVTAVLQGSGNLKLAQVLARHSNIAVTQRYAHLEDSELDRQYGEIFNGG